MMMGRVVFWSCLATTFYCHPCFAQEDETSFTAETGGQHSSDSFSFESADFGSPDSTNGTPKAHKNTAVWWRDIRSELTYENAFASRDGDQISNRFILRTQLEKLLTDKWYFQFDGKANLHMFEDHKAQDEDRDTSLHYDIREAYLQTTIGNTSVLFGYQVLVWSEMLSLSIVDITNAFDQTEFVYRERDYTRMGEPMVIVEHFANSLQYTLYAKPSNIVNDVPRFGSYMDITPYDPILFDVHRQHDEDYEAGFRIRRSGSKSEFSLIGSFVNDDEGVYEIAGMDTNSRVQVDKIHNSYNFFGAVGNFTLDRFTFKGEFGYEEGKLFQRDQIQGVLPPDETRDSKVIAGSFEYITNSSYFYSLEYSITKIENWNPQLTQDEYRRELFAIFNKRYINDALTTQWTYYRDLNMDFAFHEFKLFYRVNNEFTLGGFYHHFRLPDEENFPIQDPNRITAHFIVYF